jgi:hypothetical protein
MSELTNKLYELKESCLFDVDSMINGTFVIEGKVSSEKDLYDYAMAIAKKAFGDEVDEKKVQGIVDNAMKDSDGDFGKATGIVSGSFTEDCDKVITEICEDCENDPCECDEITEAKYNPNEDDLKIVKNNQTKIDKINSQYKNTDETPKLFGSVSHIMPMRDFVNKYFKNLNKSEQAGMASYIINNSEV